MFVSKIEGLVLHKKKLLSLILLCIVSNVEKVRWKVLNQKSTQSKKKKSKKN